jgi:hypothetical protein
MCETIAGPEQSRGFDLLVQRALRNQDPLAFKVRRCRLKPVFAHTE